MIRNTRQLSLTDDHSCALSTQGNIACWGDNMRYLLGPGSYLFSKTIAESNLSLALSMGSSHACLIKANNAAQCWGDNNYQLGTGRTRRELSPTNVMGKPHKRYPSGRKFHMPTNSIRPSKMLGNNYSGQLGIDQLIAPKTISLICSLNWLNSVALHQKLQLVSTLLARYWIINKSNVGAITNPVNLESQRNKARPNLKLLRRCAKAGAR